MTTMKKKTIATTWIRMIRIGTTLKSRSAWKRRRTSSIRLWVKALAVVTSSRRASKRARSAGTSWLSNAATGTASWMRLRTW